MSKVDLSTIDYAVRMYPQSVLLRDIRQCLSNGDTEMARVLYFNDGDKLHQYPGASLAVEHYVGCRLHGENNCKANLCQWLTRKRVELANEAYRETHKSV